MLELEGECEGLQMKALQKNDLFVSAVLQATLIAHRSHQAERLEALKNAVPNIATFDDSSDDVRMIFLNLIDIFTPTYLRVLRFFQDEDNSQREAFRRQRDLTDQVARGRN